MDKKASYMINKLHNAYCFMSGIDLTYVRYVIIIFFFQKDKNSIFCRLQWFNSGSKSAWYFNFCSQTICRKNTIISDKFPTGILWYHYCSQVNYVFWNQAWNSPILHRCIWTRTFLTWKIFRPIKGCLCIPYWPLANIKICHDPCGTMIEYDICKRSFCFINCD